jgi:hypothetical protein
VGELEDLKEVVTKEPDLVFIKDMYESERSTPLMCACESDESSLEKVRFLLDYDAPINETDKKGKTALVRAGERGNISVVKLLLERGADPTIDHPYIRLDNDECREASKVSCSPCFELGRPSSLVLNEVSCLWRIGRVRSWRFSCGRLGRWRTRPGNALCL